MHSVSTFVIQQILTRLVSDTVLNTRDTAIKITTEVPHLLGHKEKMNKQEK